MRPRNARYEKVHSPAGSANGGKPDVPLQHRGTQSAMDAGVAKPDASVRNSTMIWHLLIGKLIGLVEWSLWFSNWSVVAMRNHKC